MEKYIDKGQSNQPKQVVTQSLETLEIKVVQPSFIQPFHVSYVKPGQEAKKPQRNKFLKFQHLPSWKAVSRFLHFLLLLLAHSILLVLASLLYASAPTHLPCFSASTLPQKSTDI